MVDVQTGATREVTEVTASPNPVRANTPVMITIGGRGQCSFTVDFGDGNTQPGTGILPQQIRHNYPKAGSYVINAMADAPCSGDKATVLDVLPSRHR